ncbi:nuclear transport factor 2 family protein [Ideonella azotifigens]|uniref:SnoaL-like domain-containing protein n=1 Tax=Ideonella azotifigens TaxID=513160 RepID=A0ABN1JK81_9BURK|nr:nuclear transport factor 2 family protein [Ideonella azotifigens]MCD2341868.1 nuclear transport factor 2 family protein [Ideonella azotifigens]
MRDARQTTWETYTNAWREASADAKAAALAQSVAPACVYQDPLVTARGHRELIDYMLDFHRQVPGGHFVTTSFLAHHDASVAKWHMVDGDGKVLGDGVSFGQYDGQGALVAMTGFFEVPAQ